MGKANRHVSTTKTRTVAIPAKSDHSEYNAQSEALERILSGPQWDVSENGRMPTTDERNARGKPRNEA